MIGDEDHKQIECPNIDSWEQVFKKLYKESQKTDKLNPELVVPTDQLPNPEKAEWDFSSAELLSLDQGAERVYRDDRMDNSLQVRVYNDGEIPGENQYSQSMYHIQLDGHNPKEGIDEMFAHLFHDIINIKVSAFH